MFKGGDGVQLTALGFSGEMKKTVLAKAHAIQSSTRSCICKQNLQMVCM